MFYVLNICKNVLVSLTHFLLGNFTNVLTLCYLISLKFTMTHWQVVPYPPISKTLWLYQF